MLKNFPEPKSIHTYLMFSFHFSISVKRSSNYSMDILKHNSTDILNKTNTQENWNPSYEDKFNVSNFDADTKGNVFRIGNVDRYRYEYPE